jgi:hypothetical protein
MKIIRDEKSCDIVPLSRAYSEPMNVPTHLLLPPALTGLVVSNPKKDTESARCNRALFIFYVVPK